MSQGKMRVVSGQINYSKMTNKVSAEDYAVVKAHIWLGMLRDNAKPTKWFKANRFGTKVNFEPITTKEEIQPAINEFTDYLNKINNEFGVNLEFNYRKKEDEHV